MEIIPTLDASPEPGVRFKLHAHVLGAEPGFLATLQEAVRDSPRAAQLLQHRDDTGRLQPTANPYAKWQGAHWTLASLADIGYPPGAAILEPIRDQLLELWLHESFYNDIPCTSKQEAYRRRGGVPVMHARHRRCASQQSNLLWSLLRLDLMNDAAHGLIERLLYWQWPDGGWNCDKNPDASHSSFMESILPLRALALYGKVYNDAAASEAAARAAEIFLKRQLYLGERSGAPIKRAFTELHYPLYWHYDVLHGLKVLGEAGYLDDPRCRLALDLLESRRLPDGGWPAEGKFYKCAAELANGNESVDWGGTSRKKMNPWVTVEALTVLRTAGRLG